MSAFKQSRIYWFHSARNCLRVFTRHVLEGCNSRGAFAMLIVSVLANIALKFTAPDWLYSYWIVFLSCLVVGYFVSNMDEGYDALDRLERDEFCYNPRV